VNMAKQEIIFVSSRDVRSPHIDSVLRGDPVVITSQGLPVAALVRLPKAATNDEKQLARFIAELQNLTAE